MTIIHWRPEEASPQVDALRKLGHEVIAMRPASANLKPFREQHPDAWIIDLSRLPSHGLAVGAMLRSSRSTRYIPLVFAGGAPDKVEKIRARLPDAIYAEWPQIDAALTSAPDSVPSKPAVLPHITGYTSAPTAKKLGIIPECTVTVLGAPEEYPECLDIPESVTIHRRPGHPSQRVLVFVDRAAQLEPRFHAAERSLTAKGNIWLIWPKQASGVKTDVTQQVVRSFALERGWVDYKVCAVDKIWSGILFGRKRS